MTHLIKHLSFGKDYPGIVNPLDETEVTAPQGQRFHGFTVVNMILVEITITNSLTTMFSFYLKNTQYVPYFTPLGSRPKLIVKFTYYNHVYCPCQQGSASINFT